MHIATTPYADVNELLELLLSRIQAILGEKLVGLYLYGSLAAGDFDYESSDIDFVAATSIELDEHEIAALKTMHEDIVSDKGEWGERLEGAYISIAALRRYDPNYRQPFLSPGSPFRVTNLGADWVINRHTLREKGVVIYGPSPTTLIDPISREELTDAVRGCCKEWRDYISRPEDLRPRKLQAFAILTMCRILYALQQGQFVSKLEAARWAEKNLDPEWTSLIQRALVWRLEWRDEQVDPDATLEETLRFVRFALRQC